jgi:aspartyl-tRNA(Asn)/glutamyl-tRNA(Gln) amidotransferase subunit C
MNENQPQTELTDDEIRHVAHLARLAITVSEVSKAKKDLTAIFTHISRLSAVDTGGVQPLDNPTELLNHLREDTRSDTLSQQQVLANAPVIKDVYFAVPKVLGEST